ncbi:MAG: hypothetical protein ACREOO_26085 [bacterium]
MHHSRHLAILLFFLSFAFLAHAQSDITPCNDEPGDHKLDFWLGEWAVFTKDGNQAGENRIEKVLKGCAIIENWRAIDGSEGKSWFYFDTHARKWKQVWVTEKATSPGGTKEKAVIEEFESPYLFYLVT